MSDRVQTRQWDAWKDDWFWMLGQFSGSVWFSLYMATAPRILATPVK